LKVFDDIIQSGDFSNARFCFIDIEKEVAKCKALSFDFFLFLGDCFFLSIHATPAIQFYWNGKVLTIRRPNWDDDNKCFIVL
jgi:hypothetical protein